MNETELKYPIKYAIMPVEEQTGWRKDIHDLTPIFTVVAHMAVKCYVVNEKVSYRSDGNSRSTYDVVFLYDRPDCVSKFAPAQPEFSISDSCTNSVAVDTVFDSFSDAQTAARKKDEEMFEQVKRMNLPQNYMEALPVDLNSWFKDTFEEYRETEAILEELSKGIEITKSYGEILEDLIDRILSNSKDFYVQLAKSLPLQERVLLRRALDKRTCDNCQIRNCHVDASDRAELVECLHCDNDELIGRQFILEQQKGPHSHS